MPAAAAALCGWNTPHGDLLSDGLCLHAEWVRLPVATGALWYGSGSDLLSGWRRLHRQCLLPAGTDLWHVYCSYLLSTGYCLHQRSVRLSFGHGALYEFG